MTTFFLRRSVEKAFQLDESPSDLTLDRHRPLGSHAPYITSAVDDIMCIVDKVLHQSLATAQRAIVTSVVPTLARVLGSEFIGMVQRKMRDESYPRAVVAGAQPPESTTIAFLVLINNLDVAVDYVQRIVKNNMESPAASGAISTDATSDGDGTRISALFPYGNDAEAARSALRSCSTSFESKTRDLINDGIQVVFNNVINSRLRPILADAFRDIEYEPDERAENEDYGGHDINGGVGGLDEETDVALVGGSIVRARFTTAWRDLLVPISRILTARTFDRLLSVTVAALARLLEKRIWSYHGRVNALGATRLERDVTGIVGAAVDVGSGEPGTSGGRYRYRDAFGRCVQIVTVMGMEEEEWDEVVNGGMEVVDRLSTEERMRARAMVHAR